MATDSAKRIVRNVEAWGDSFPPACECGCGEPSRFGAKGLQRYVNRQHAAWGKDYRSMSEAARRKRQTENIEIEKFRSAVRELKRSKNMTWAQMAAAVGQQPGWLHTYMFDKRLKTVSRKVASDFLRRLSGEPTVATKFEQRDVRRVENRIRAAKRQIGVDPGF